jgi:hypothetical protein
VPLGEGHLGKDVKGCDIVCCGGLGKLPHRHIGCGLS